MLSEPKIAFSHWVAWKDRADLRTPKPMMGVYMWAHFHEPPDRTVHPYPTLPEELVYVGETNDLNARPLRGNRHQRLEHYRDTFPADAKLDHLYVAVFRVREYQPDSPHRRTTRAFTQFAEGKLYWGYTRCYERRAALPRSTTRPRP